MRLDGRVLQGPVQTMPSLPNGSALWQSYSGIAESEDIPFDRPDTAEGRSLRSFEFGASHQVYTTNTSVINALRFGSSNFTIRFWLKYSKSPAGTYHRLLSFNGLEQVQASEWNILSTDGSNLLFSFLQTSGVAVDIAFGSTADAVGKWALYEVNRRGEMFYFYCNGQLIRTDVNSSPVKAQPDRGFYLGSFWRSAIGSPGVQQHQVPAGTKMTQVEVYKGVSRWNSGHLLLKYPWGS